MSAGPDGSSPPDQTRPVPSALDTRDVVAAVRVFGEALAAHRTTIDRLNVYPVPDGDTGTNMALTLASVADELVSVASAGRAEVCRAISHGALMGARGNSGVIVSQLLRGLAATLAPPAEAGTGIDSTSSPDAEPPIGASLLAEGLMAASTAADSAVMRPVEGTILSVARASAHAALRTAAVGGAHDGASHLVAVLETARKAGQVALERTPQQLPVLADAGVVDAGAAGYLLLLDALLNVADGRPLPQQVELPADVAAVIAHGNAVVIPTAGSAQNAAAQRRDEMHSHLGADAEHDPSGTQYEVMFLLAASDERIDGFKTAWDQLGDSIVMVGGDGLWNCHIHTDDIGATIEAGIDIGRPHRIQITDLHAQVAGLGAPEGHVGGHGAVAAEAHRTAASREQLNVECAVVAVSPAAGLDDLFVSMGTHQLVTGGQTMNPSVAELLAAVEASPSQQVIVLPNNSNIVGVARQVGGQTNKTVAVVPTTSVPAGLSALIGYNADADAESNVASMGDAAQAVTTGEVTRAVRDTVGPAGSISAGDWIGLDAEGIAAAGETAALAAVDLLARLLHSSHEILTLIEGADAVPAQTDEVLAWLADQWPDIEVERHAGGQDHYPYFFGVE